MPASFGEAVDVNAIDFTTTHDNTDSSECRLAYFHGDSEKPELYHSAVLLRTEIESKNSSNRILWPPDSYDLDLLHCNNSVPPILFNFICLIVGLNNENKTMSKMD